MKSVSKFRHIAYSIGENQEKMSNTVAMVTYCVTKMVTTCSPMVGQFFDTMIVALSDKEWP